MNPNLEGGFKTRLERWEKQMFDYEQMTSKTVDEDLKLSIFQEKIAPVEVQEHLYLNASRLDTYEKMLAEVESYVLAKRGGTEGDDPMDVCALERGGGKGVCRLWIAGKCHFGRSCRFGTLMDANLR